VRATTTLLAAALLFACAGPAAAQAVKIEFTGGRVTLMAQNAPARAVLAEWARLGGTRIVNGDQVAGAPLTLQLVDYPERQALDIVLRNVPGYIVSARPSPGVGGASAFDRVLILATSSAPRPTNAATFGAPPQRPPTFDTDADDFVAVQRANEQNRAAERATGQPVVVTQSPNGAVVIRQGAAPQPFFPDAPATAPAPAQPPGQAARPASPFAPTPVPPQQPQDSRPPNTTDR
jgi:hypothetical protein